MSAPSWPTQSALSKIIFESLRRASPEALMWGDPEMSDSDVLIDGTFNFLEVARLVRMALERPDRLER